MTLTPITIAIMVLCVAGLAYIACSIWEDVQIWKLRDAVRRLRAEAED